MSYDTSDFDYACLWGTCDAYEELGEFMKYMRSERSWVNKQDYESALWAWLSHRTEAVEKRLAKEETRFYQHVQGQPNSEGP
jgi:hypothetical protein